MLSRIISCGVLGIEGFKVEVETDISNGLPSFNIVGLGGTAVKESKERVRAAIKNSGFKFPTRRITINLAPADLKKEGSAYDLPIALGILTATGTISSFQNNDFMFIGELSLDGCIKKINGALAVAYSAAGNNIKNLVLPFGNADEAAVVKKVDILPARNINDIVNHLNKKDEIKKHNVDIKSMFQSDKNYNVDFSEVKGQANVKRALEIAASGGHNCLMIGSPGCGKTMISKRLPTILPDMTLEESLEASKIYSVAGLLPEGGSLITRRPFRSPHHSISNVGLIGGGRSPKPGEISLAHFGVLFLDELPEFKKSVLEVMRQPLEDREVNISRINASITYPADFILVAACNPCKCGYLLDPHRQCTCTMHEIDKYIGKLSGPLLDRIDIQVEMLSVDINEIQKSREEETSAVIRERVNRTRQVQLDRYKDLKIYSNSQLQSSMISKYCKIDSKGRKLMENAFKNLALSARAYTRILKVARTLADMDECRNIREKHLAEAVQYRSLDRKFWTKGNRGII